MKPILPFFLPICLRFPEIRYFQDDDVRTKLTDILFCYARENEQLLYKQVRQLILKLKGKKSAFFILKGPFLKNGSFDVF